MLLLVAPKGVAGRVEKKQCLRGSCGFMSTSKHRLCIEDERGETRKVAMIVSNERGISISVPYHKARQGQFLLIRPPDQPGIHAVRPHGRYVASSRAKLSLHPPHPSEPDTTFVHFSGDGIVSGRDEDGRPKGFSLIGPPISEITTGPTMGLTVWGLADFDPPRARDANLVTIRQSDMHPATGGDLLRGLTLEMFLLPNSLRKSSRRLGVFYKEYVFEGIKRGFYLKVIELPGLDRFLGVACIRRPVTFTGSGYTLVSPRIHGWMLCAAYPPQFSTEGHISLDHTQADFAVGSDWST